MSAKSKLIPVIALATGGILLFAAVRNVNPIDLIKSSLSETKKTLNPISQPKAFGGNKAPTTGTPGIAPGIAQTSRK